MEELLGCGVVLPVLSGLFVGHELRIRAQLLLDRAAVQEGAYFVEEDIVRRTVADEVMHIAVEVQRLLRPYDREAAEQVFGQIKWPYELGTVGLELGFLLL